MNELRVLCYEDDPGDLANVRAYLTSAWKLVDNEKIKAPDGINISSESNPPQALNEILHKIDQYDLLVVDMLYEHPETGQLRNVGNAMIQLARASKRPLGIIGISALEQEDLYLGSREDFDKYAKGIHAGLHGTWGRRFIRKRDLYEIGGISLQDLANIMETVLVDAGVFDSGTSSPASPPELKWAVHNGTRSYMLSAIRDKIGKAHLGELISPFLQAHEKECTIDYVTPGLSGAMVLRVTTDHSRSILLKVSSNEDALRRELEQFPKVGEVLRVNFIPYIDNHTQTVDHRWFALAAHFGQDAITMTERIESAVQPDDVERLMTDVFINGLKPAYSQTEAVAQPDNVFDALVPAPAYRVGRIHLALEKLGFLAWKYTRDSESPFDPKILTNFLNAEERKIGGIEKVLRQAAYCINHGDLHGRNILVARSGSWNRLIDPSECGTHHWAADLARFCVDLFVHSWDNITHHGATDPNATNAYEWQHFGEWRALTDAFVSGRSLDSVLPPPAEPPNLGVYTALEWCRTHLHDIHADRIDTSNPPGWEFQLALAAEFMRAGYRIHVPTPKNVLGLVAAHDALLRCAERLSRVPADK